MLSLLVACGSPASPPSGPEDATGSDLKPPCEAAFAPVESLRQATEDAAARWSLATDCDISVEAWGTPGAVPIERALSLPYQDGGAEAPGWTRDDRQLVLINQRTGAEQLPRCVNHELGHALGGEHVVGDGVLSGKKIRSDVIDTPALESVCLRLPCRGRHPEG